MATAMKTTVTTTARDASSQPARIPSTMPGTTTFSSIREVSTKSAPVSSSRTPVSTSVPSASRPVSITSRDSVPLVAASIPSLPMPKSVPGPMRDYPGSSQPAPSEDWSLVPVDEVGPVVSYDDADSFKQTDVVTDTDLTSGEGTEPGADVPLYKKPWFWAVAVLGVGAIGAGVYYSTRPKRAVRNGRKLHRNPSRRTRGHFHGSARKNARGRGYDLRGSGDWSIRFETRSSDHVWYFQTKAEAEAAAEEARKHYSTWVTIADDDEVVVDVGPQGQRSWFQRHRANSGRRA